MRPPLLGQQYLQVKIRPERIARYGVKVVVIGGLVTSTLLTLVLLPTLYAWFEGRAERKLIDRPRGKETL